MHKRNGGDKMTFNSITFVIFFTVVSLLLLLTNKKTKIEKDKITSAAKQEVKKIVSERLMEAESIISKLEEMYKLAELETGGLIEARTLKNKIADKVYEGESEDMDGLAKYAPISADKLKVGMKVFVGNANQEGIVQSIRPQKNEAEILCGNMRIRSKIFDLSVLVSPQNAQTAPKKAKNKKPSNGVQITKSLNPKAMPSLEINVIGLTVAEALPEVEAFIDSAVISNLEEVRIVHGVGTGKLRAGIHEYLREHSNVLEFRLGKYGEGETGVTIVKLK
jgi:DNA mismatch repair protein MutS2